jgi:CRISPR/Cas system-associated protein endoribonuclease Cas2
MLTQTNKDYLELTEKQYDYIELLLTTALQEWKLQGMDIAKGIYNPS